MAFKQKSKKKPNVFHPLLIGLYPVLALLAVNIIQLDPIYAIRAIVVTLLISILVLILSTLILHDHYKGGLLASLVLLLFFTYGHLYFLVDNKSFFGHHRVLIPLWILIFGLGTWGILRLKKKPRTLTTFLNFFSIVLVAIPVFQIALFELQQTKSNVVVNEAVDSVWEPETTAPAGSPDVYYIILDAYSRSDMLQKYYKFDNSQFLADLREMGFYVADCSMSNYSYTPSSMSSALNMDYMDNYAPAVLAENQNLYNLGDYIKHSKVRELFSSLGYRFVTFETNIWWLDITDSDEFISQYSSPWQKLLDFKTLGNFEKYYMRTTALRVVDELSTSLQNRYGRVMLSAEKAHYNQVIFNFEQLAELPSSDNPKFVYAHFVAPHFPYVFNPDGTFTYSLADDPGYINETQYVNQQILDALQKIITESETPPVILLQSDHGFKTAVRNANLMAYYLPNGGIEDLYPTITPVNSFRIVFNNYFGADYPLLPDVARSATYEDPYNFTVVDYPCQAK